MAFRPLFSGRVEIWSVEVLEKLKESRRTLRETLKDGDENQQQMAHFENEWWPGSIVTAQVIVGLLGGTIIVANVP